MTIEIEARRPRASLLIAGLGACLAANAASAESLAAMLGKVEYRNNCMVCHGDTGAGDGPMADQLTQKPADLRQISSRHNGVFPFDKVYDIIDGRETVRAHGTSEMPVWGEAYAADVSALSGKRDPERTGIEPAIAGRVLSLVYYIRSLQID